jgi:hypothetical protein
VYQKPVRVTVTLTPTARRAQYLYRRAITWNICAALVCLAVVVPALWLRLFFTWAPGGLLVAFAMLYFARRDSSRAREMS